MESFIRIVWFSLLLGCTMSMAGDSVWDYHYRQLHQSLAKQDWYAAKQALAHLKDRDQATYEAEGYEETAALIAFNQAHWDTAYRSSRAVSNWSPATVKEMAISLEKMKRYGEALAHTELEGVRFTGDDKWEVYALRARCLEASGHETEAVSYLEKLTGSKVPVQFRLPAYKQLLKHYYQAGKMREARKIAEYLQTKRSVSDAALYSVDLQEQYEPQDYLSYRSVIKRFARVCYQNRDYTRSDHYYGLLEDISKGDEAARARYFIALTHLKQGLQEEGLTAFSQAVPKLSGTRYGGLAAFQYARALFMNEQYQETIAFTNRFRAENSDGKWANECMRLNILALRRLGHTSEFEALEAKFKKEGAPAWLHQFYYRNGVVWAMSDKRHRQAQIYLEKYARYRMKWHERQEADLWSGLISWELGEYEAAVEAWLDVVAGDPNHFFGLVARELIAEGRSETMLWENRWKKASSRLTSLTTRELRDLYYLAPDDALREPIGELLATHLPEGIFIGADNPFNTDSESHRLARIGRYDLAALSFSKKGRSSQEYHYVKARWNLKANHLHQSISHGEILTDSYPKWAPYELMPEEVQELAFPRGFSEIVQNKAGDYNVDPYLLLAIIREESRFNASAKSWASARGLMQFIPDTAREMAHGVDELGDFELSMLYDPNTSITLGAKYVDHLMETFEGRSLYTIAAYNAGPNAVNRWRGFSDQYNPLMFVWDVTYDETRFYCQKVFRAYHHYTRVYEDGSSRILPGHGLQENRILRLDTANTLE